MSSATIPLTGTSQGAPPHSAPVTAGPVQPSERVELVDVLRGLCLLGIILANWGRGPAGIGPFVDVLIANKFYPIFAFLFGLGFSVQLLRARASGQPYALRYIWRMALLFVIGVAHFSFIWEGDIIRSYAKLGLILLLVPWRHPRLVLALALATLVLSSSSVSSATLKGLFVRPDPALAQQAALADNRERATDALRQAARVGPRETGTYGAWVAAGSGAIPRQVTRMGTLDFWLGGFFYIGLFVLGMYTGIQRILHEPERHTRLFVGLITLGIVVGLPGQVYANLDGVAFLERIGDALPERFLSLNRSNLIYEISSVALALAYMAAIALFYSRNARSRSMLAPFAPMGRMSLTNYIMQSVFMVFLLWPWGLGLDDAMIGWPRLLVIVLVYALQVGYSQWWFARFRFGPVEWLWRSLTWFKLQPMRLRQRVPSESGVRAAPEFAS